MSPDPPFRRQRDKWQCMDCVNHKAVCWICHKEGYDANFYQEMVSQGLIEGVEPAEDNSRHLKAKKRRVKKKSADDDYEAYSAHGARSRRGSFKQNPLINNPNVLFKCLVKTCGRFYHIACIQSLDYGSKEHFTDMTKFRCPVHFCCRCKETGNTKHLVACVMCCNASHVGCLDETSGHRMSKLYYICNKHEVPRGVPSWDPNKKKMITDDVFLREERRSRAHRQPAEKTVYAPVEYSVPIEQYQGNWCRYCGARRSRSGLGGKC